MLNTTSSSSSSSSSFLRPHSQSSHSRLATAFGKVVQHVALSALSPSSAVPLPASCDQDLQLELVRLSQPTSFTAATASSTVVACPPVQAKPAPRSKRPHGSIVPSSRAVIRCANKVKRLANKLSVKSKWEQKECCRQRCFEQFPLTDQQLVQLRSSIHGHQDETAKRQHYKMLLLYSSSTSAQAAALYQTQQLRSGAGTPSVTTMSIFTTPLPVYSPASTSPSATSLQRSHSQPIVSSSSNSSPHGISSEFISRSNSISGGIVSNSSCGSVDMLGLCHTGSESSMSGGHARGGTKTRSRSHLVICVDGTQSPPVCMSYFKWVYRVSNDFHYAIFNEGRVQRSLHCGQLQAESCRKIRLWLTDFATWHEYMPNQQLIQLPYSTKSQVYEYYKRDMNIEADLSAQPARCRDEIASLSYFLQVWRKHEFHIVLRRHLQFSICNECASLRRHRDQQWTQTELERNQRQFQQHIAYVKEERHAYHNKRDLARNDPTQFISIIMDGSTQYGYKMPHFKETTKLSSSVEQMKWHVTAVLVHGRRALMFTSNDRWIGGTSASVEIMQRTLVHLEKERPLPPVLYLQLDNTGKDNKSNYFFVYLAWLVRRQVFQRIEVSFLPVGHTHEDIDQLFSRTSVRLRNINVLNRQEFEKQLKESYTCLGNAIVENLDAVIDWKDWIDHNALFHKVPALRNIQHFKFERDSQSRVRLMQKVKINDQWSGFESGDADGHVLLASFMPLELPFSINSSCSNGHWNTGRYVSLDSHPARDRIIQLTVPNATPRTAPDNHSTTMANMKRGLDQLYGAGLVKRVDYELLDEDLKTYNDRKPQPLSKAWERHGLLKSEVDRLVKAGNHQAAAIAAEMGEFYHGSHPLDSAIEQAARAAQTEAEAAEQPIFDEDEDEYYGKWMEMQSLEKLDKIHWMLDAKPDDYVILSGDPIYVAKIKRRGFYEEGDPTSEMMEIVWHIRDKHSKCPWTARYRMEPNAHRPPSKAPAPVELPLKHQFISTVPVYEAYAKFTLQKNRTIPMSVVTWMREYTNIEDEWKGRERELEEVEEKQEANQHR